VQIRNIVNGEKEMKIKDLILVIRNIKMREDTPLWLFVIFLAIAGNIAIVIAWFVSLDSNFCVLK
jgi:hypothetical protein